MINIKFRTTNSLENYNRIFEHRVKMNPNMQLVLYIDNLLNIANERINNFFFI